MANNDSKKVFVSFNGVTITGWGGDGPTIQLPETVSSTYGLQGYVESTQKYDGDRTITISVFRSSEGFQYLQQCYFNRTRGGLVVRDTNEDINMTYKVSEAQVKQLGDIKPGSEDTVEVTFDCSEIELG